MVDYAEDALDMELEIYLNECEFGEDYELDWPEPNAFGMPLSKVKKRERGR